MIILGIADSHESHACLMIDGQVVAAISEERLTRLKSDGGYPERAIEKVLQMGGVKPEQVDHVAIASEVLTPFQIITNREATFSVQDWIKLNKEYWKPKLLEGKTLPDHEDIRLFRDKVDPKRRYSKFMDHIDKVDEETGLKIMNDIRIEAVTDHLGIDKSKIQLYYHEDCHKAYSLLTCPYDESEAMIFSMEGNGDVSSASTSTYTRKGNDLKIEEHWNSAKVQFGRLYRYMTLILGMKPDQHEYKVMGLAPYGSEYHGKRSLEFFRTINKVNGLTIEDTKTIPDLYYSVKDALEGERFDGMAWGLQTWLEEIVTEWISNNVSHYGIGNVMLTGGVAQNIKMCKRIWELSNVSRFWVGPTTGDGSLALGAVWLASRKLKPETPIKKLEHVYLGSYDNQSKIDRTLRDQDLSEFKVVQNPDRKSVARWIADGKIVARYSGGMEFGQRALGNRSILADPRNPKVVDHINQKIKSRDFWMPFTPSFVIEEADRMVHNPKNLYSPFMTIAFDLKPEFRDSIPAAVHPADRTVRPQMLRRELNPGYYDLMAEFKKISGMGVLLNTSFNLHGDAIVESAADAMETFKKSDLDVVLFDHVAVTR